MVTVRPNELISVLCVGVWEDQRCEVVRSVRGLLRTTRPFVRIPVAADQLPRAAVPRSDRLRLHSGHLHSDRLRLHRGRGPWLSRWRHLQWQDSVGEFC